MLSQAQIEVIYDQLREYHSKYLQEQGVKLPALRRRGNFTKNALVLTYLARDYPDTRAVSKQELTDFIRQFYPGTVDVQQARHLGMQKGWYIVSGTRGNSSALGPGQYQLVTLEQPHPAFRPQRTLGFAHTEFEELKRQYGFRCPTCGSKEGESMYQYPSVVTRLTQAHMNPRERLVAGNVIPQCDVCNRAYRNYWVFDSRGRVIAVSDARVILQSPEQVQLEIYTLLREKFERGEGV